MKGRLRLGKQDGMGLALGVACFAGSIFSFAAIVDSLSGKGALHRLDLAINSYMIKVTTPGLTALMGAVSAFGSIYLVVAVAVLVGAIFFIRKNRWGLLALFLAVGAGQVVLNLIKVVFQRPRPETDLFVFSYSFPSGHAFSATVIYGFCIYALFRFFNNAPAKWLVSALLMLLILLIGFSRIYLGVHWLSDTLAGYATGFAWLVFSVFVAETVGER